MSSGNAALTILSMTAFIMMLRSGISDIKNMRADEKVIRMTLTGFDDEIEEAKHHPLH
ncbi:TPA: hypothetical protein JZG04_004675 [Escherichia coli]|nr:hypothetical protein [Escherichia coli]HAX5171970.1 hypothetical protein [Escherichia coli]